MGYHDRKYRYWNHLEPQYSSTIFCVQKRGFYMAQWLRRCGIFRSQISWPVWTWQRPGWRGKGRCPKMMDQTLKIQHWLKIPKVYLELIQLYIYTHHNFSRFLLFYVFWVATRPDKPHPLEMRFHVTTPKDPRLQFNIISAWDDIPVLIGTVLQETADLKVNTCENPKKKIPEVLCDFLRNLENLQFSHDFLAPFWGSNGRGTTPWGPLDMGGEATGSQVATWNPVMESHGNLGESHGKPDLFWCFFFPWSFSYWKIGRQYCAVLSCCVALVEIFMHNSDSGNLSHRTGSHLIFSVRNVKHI